MLTDNQLQTLKDMQDMIGIMAMVLMTPPTADPQVIATMSGSLEGACRDYIKKYSENDNSGFHYQGVVGPED